MKRENTIGFRIRTLSVGIKRAVDTVKTRGEGGCTGTHGWVIGYLYENREREVYQRDIEKQFSVRRPTMTAILQLMEKNGLVERIRDDNDARLKKIKLTPLALEIHERHEQVVGRFEQYIREGITDSELETFFRVMDKLSENIADAEKNLLMSKEENKC